MTVASLSKTELLQDDEKNKIRWELKLDEIRCKWDKMKMRWDEKESKTMTRTETRRDEMKWNTARRIL